MNAVNTFILTLGITLTLAAATTQAAQKQWSKAFNNSIDSVSSQTLDEHEKLHLVFMRSEEKLARDVYTYLGLVYPELNVFGKIDDAEQRHMDAVLDKLVQYDIPDPVTNDNTGVFTGEEYGEYFTDTYNTLIEMGASSNLDALYVGALIEELDIHDINLCPEEIVLQDNDLYDDEDCGKLYSDNPDIQRLYASLLAGSEKHLQAYVRNIEKFIGAGNYQAQILTPDQLDDIINR